MDAGSSGRECVYVINVDVPNLFGNPLDAPPPVMFVVRVCDAYTYPPHIYKYGFRRPFTIIHAVRRWNERIAKIVVHGK